MDNVFYFIYKITNLINNKLYIGKTVNINRRWASHKRAASKKNKKDYSYLHRAMNKYGYENFKIEEIANFYTERLCFEAEIYYIDFYKTRDKNIGYNLTKGGDGPTGYTFSKESRDKMSKAKKGVYDGDKNPMFGVRNFGEKNPRSILTKEKVLEIRENKNKLTVKELATKYAVKEITIYKIFQRNIWSHI